MKEKATRKTNDGLSVKLSLVAQMVLQDRFDEGTEIEALERGEDYNHNETDTFIPTLPSAPLRRTAADKSIEMKSP